MSHSAYHVWVNVGFFYLAFWTANCLLFLLLGISQFQVSENTSEFLVNFIPFFPLLLQRFSFTLRWISTIHHCYGIIWLLKFLYENWELIFLKHNTYPAFTLLVTCDLSKRRPNLILTPRELQMPPSHPGASWQRALYVIINQL